MSEDVLVEKRDDGIAKITLNRPDSLNAMGGQLMPMLAQALAEASTDRKVRCVVLTGEAAVLLHALPRGMRVNAKRRILLRGLPVTAFVMVRV